MIHPALGIMVTVGTMVTIRPLTQDVIPVTHIVTVTMVTFRLQPQGVIQVIHIVMVILRPVTHQLNLQSQRAIQTIHIATPRS